MVQAALGSPRRRPRVALGEHRYVRHLYSFDSQTTQPVFRPDIFRYHHKIINTTLLAIYVTVLAVHILFRVPRRGARLMLAGMRCVLKTSKDLKGLAGNIPKDPRTLYPMFPIDPITDVFVCCPACFCLYPYAPNN